MKKSSDNTNRPRKLEEVFRDGFEPAEVSPRASIWHHIEQELEVKQAGYYKKRLVWYRSVAAASITLLLVAISYFWYDAQTGHQLKLPGSSSGQIVQDKSNPGTPKIAKTNINDTPKQSRIVENLKKEPHEDPILKNQKPEQIAFSFNNSRKNKTSSAIKTNPEQLVVNQQHSLSKPLNSDSNNLTTADKPEEGNLVVKENEEGTQNNNVALQPAQSVTESNLPVDSSQVIIAKEPLKFKNDSAAVLTAALLPEETKKKTIGSRWALGGGTGSQYFEQNIKFANAGTNSFASPSANYSNTAVNRSPGGNTIEAASKEFNENTRSAFSYRAAVAANYRINDKWSVEAGLTFAENKAQTTTSYIINKRPAALQAIANIKSEYALSDYKSNDISNTVTIPVTIFLARLTDTDLTNAQVTVEQVAPFNMYYRYRQLGVPVRLRYQHGRGKWFNFVQAGGALNVLLQTSILSDSPKVPSVEYPLGHSSPFRKWYVTALGSVGRGLKISEVWQVQGSLDVARNFSTITLSPDQIPNLSQQKPYYVGFGISSSYVIGRK